MSTRIYVVSVDDANEEPAQSLVEATSQTQALLHVAKSMITVAVAKPKDIAALMKAGTVLESAGKAEGDAE